MIETPMYEGATPQRRTEPDMIKLNDVGVRATQESVNRAAAGIDMMEETYKYIVDYGTHKNAQKQLSDATAEYDEGVKEASALAPGTAGSLWREDYSLNEDRLAELRREYEEKVGQIQPRFLDTRRGFAFEEQRGDIMGRTLERAEGHAHDLRLKMARQGVDDRVQNYLLKGNVGGALGEIDGAVGAGLMSKVQAENKKLAIAKRGVGGSGGVRVGGTDYEGWEAQLAAEAAKGDKSPDLRFTNYDLRFGENSAASPRGEGGEEQITLRPLEAWERDGEEGGIIGLMSDAEYEGLQIGLTGQAEAVVRETDKLGGVHWSAGESAPEVAQVAVAGANKRGAMSKEEARTMVTGILLDKFKTYGGLSEDAAAKIFEDSGVYEILGDGNENMGIAEVKGIADEVKKRVADTGLKHLDEKGIEQLVEKQLDTMDFGTDKNGKRAEWARMEDIAAKINADGKYVENGKWYKNDQQGEARQDFYFALELYRKHRWEFNHKSNGGDLRKEFEKKAVEFVNWWNRTYGKKQKRVAREVQKNYLIGEIHNQLGRRADENGYGQEGENYVRDVQIARRVIETTAHAPLNDAVDAYLKNLEQQEKNTEEAIKAQQQLSAAAYQKLNEVMSAKAEEEAAAKEQAARAKKEEKKKEKKEEKAQAAAEAEAERRKRVQYALARREPRAQGWTWDGVQRGKSGALVCRVPASEMKRIRETMGYDGTQFVILRMGDSSKSVYVDMSAPAKGDTIELSSAAVKLMQDKPTRRGRKRVIPAVKHKGQADFYYEFKAIK